MTDSNDTGVETFLINEIIAGDTEALSRSGCSLSERIAVALAVDQMDELPNGYQTIREAWERLDDRQRRIVVDGHRRFMRARRAVYVGDPRLPYVGQDLVQKPFAISADAEEIRRLDAEIAGLATELAFWKWQAKWYRALFNNGGLGEPDEVDLKQAEVELENARVAENKERYAHAESPRDVGS